MPALDLCKFENLLKLIIIYPDFKIYKNLNYFKFILSN